MARGRGKDWHQAGIGACFGGGTGILAACDVVIAARQCDLAGNPMPETGSH